MYYPDSLFDSMNSNNGLLLPPPPPAIPDMTLLRSQETVATIGSMNMEFVDLFFTNKTTETAVTPSDYTTNSNDVGEEEDDDDDDGNDAPLPMLTLPPPLETTESTSLFAKAAESLTMEYLSDDSSSLWEPPRRSNKNNNKKRKVTARKAGKYSRSKPPSRRVRKTFDIAESERTYVVEYTDLDVLCQRGGLANKHPGNHRYLTAKEALQDLYRQTPKAGRTAVAQQLVDTVHAWGGRFLRHDHTHRGGGWYEIHPHTARTKAGQALREDYTPQERKEKRNRYRQAQQQEQYNDNDEDDDDDAPWVLTV
uniref:DUF6824 domain-containing protein n=1 Tax=Amphora coffeiformis TaxID=265554 RepID=A0A7S3L2K8_9STRA